MSIKSILMLLLVSVGSYVYFTFYGDAPESLIADVALIGDKESNNLDVEFTGPVRILGYYPEKYGKVVQIKLRAISLSNFDKDFSMAKLYIREGVSKDYGIKDVRYEGDVPGGPFIVVHFMQTMTFEINEGEGLRGLTLNYKPL